MGFYNRMPYTDIHNLNLDWIINAMKTLEDEWQHYGGSVTATAHSAEAPEVTVSGDFKSTVNFDFGLVRGTTGQKGERGEPGPKGEPGSGLSIKDTYATVQALKQAHPVGQEGDAYLIGTAPDFSLYIWSTSQHDYENVGTLSSPSPAITEPLMDGTADIGMDNRYARADHRHPTDSGKLDLRTNEGTTVEVYAFTGTVQNSIRVSDQPEAGKVVMYDEVNGNVNTGTATSNTNAINKGTFDNAISDLENELSEKQDKLTSGVNLAMINGLSLLNNTYIGVKSLGGSTSEGGVNMTYTAGASEEDKYIKFKTISGESIIGEGDIAGSGFSVTQLWENANPTAVFDPQTIALDLSSYKMIFVEGKRVRNDSSDNGANLGSGLAVLNGGGTIICGRTDNTTNGGALRQFYAQPDGVKFGVGRTTNTTEVLAGGAVPTRIFGIK